MRTTKTLVTLLMKRDNISKEEAQDLIRITQEEVDEALASGYEDEIEDILQENLGLEPDYLDIFL